MKRSDLRKVKISWCDQVAYFHKWTKRVKYLVAIVEKEDGKIVEVDYEDIKFLPDDDININDFRDNSD